MRRASGRRSGLVGLSPIYKFLCLKNLQKNLPQFIGSHAAIRTNPERQALVFQPSAHPCSYRHVLVHKAEGPPWPSSCCYQTGCAIGDSPISWTVTVCRGEHRNSLGEKKLPVRWPNGHRNCNACYHKGLRQASRGTVTVQLGPAKS